MKLSLKALRVDSDMTQKEFAEKLGVDVRTYHLWESGKFKINIRTRLAMQDILGTEKINFPKMK